MTRTAYFFFGYWSQACIVEHLALPARRLKLRPHENKEGEPQQNPGRPDLAAKRE